MSTDGQEFLYRQFFKLKVYASHGDSFQNLFSDLMTYYDPAFQAVAPWGNWGDGGNDGWIPAQGHYFQVYGPKPTTSISETVAVKKAVEDFDKLPSKWLDVKKYSFVMNDRFGGIPAPVASALQGLWKDKGLEYAGAIGAKELLKFFMELPSGERQDVIGGIPAELPEFVEASAVGELLSYLADNPSFSFGYLSGKAPDFDEKAEYNRLSEHVKKRIEVSSYQSFLVDDFLETDSDLKQSISEEVSRKYQESKKVISDAAEDSADLRYFWLIENLVPEVSKGNPHSLKAFWSAAELILAKYFESCDVYEDPSHNITS